MKLYELLRELKPDEWRSQFGFSADLTEAHLQLFKTGQTAEGSRTVLNNWLRRNTHPCHFGRSAASRDLHQICVLTDIDLKAGDDHVRRVIQNERGRWKARALSGQSSSFIVALICRRLAYAEPNDVLQFIAIRLCDLILGEAGVDRILLDDLVLLVENKQIRWQAGASVFAAQGDKRWWHDHRFPGGLAFSLNSIGHMTAVRALHSTRHVTDFTVQRTEYLRHWALPGAVHTIERASTGQFRCTWLLEKLPNERRPEWMHNTPRKRLLTKVSLQRYAGVYHTDHTIPSEYFRPRVVCDCVDRFELSLAYLHDPRDPEFHRIAFGIPGGC
jgi:hypothetical protein